MATRPSFLNLDEAQASINDIQNAIETNLSNVGTQSVQETKNAIDSIKNELNNLQSAMQTQDFLKPLHDRIEQIIKLFNEFENKGKQAINTQKVEIQSFMDKIIQMDDALKQSSKSLELLNNIKIGDVSSIDEYINKINSLKLSFDNMISTSDIINLDQADLDSIRSKITNFLNHLASDGMQAFNLANIMIQSANDPNVEIAFKQMLTPLNKLISEIPQNVIESFNKGTSQIGSNIGSTGGSTGSSINQSANLEQLTQALSDLAGKINNNPGTGFTMYNAELAGNERNYQDNLNVERASSKEIERLWEHVGRLGVSNEYAQKVDKGFESSKSNITTADNLVETILQSMKDNKYSDKEKTIMNNLGINDDSIVQIRDGIQDTEKLYNNYSIKNSGLQKGVKNYESALQSYSDNASAENLEKLLEAEQNVEIQANSASEALNELFNQYKGLMGGLDLTDESFLKLPQEMQDLFNSMKNVFTMNNKTADDLLKMYKAFNLELDKSADKLEKTLNSSKDSINNMNVPFGSGDGSSEKAADFMSKAGNIFSTLTKGVSGFTNGLSKAEKTLNSMGLGVGAPMTLDGIKSYINGSSQWYRKFGIQDYEGALAQVAQGGTINNGLLDENQQKGIDLQRATYGRVQYNEYTDMVNSLTSNIQGHYGQGDNKEAGQQDMSDLAGTGLMLQKIYGVDSSSAIGTFYKELGMGTQETLDLLGKLTSTAQGANIPVSQYVKTISDLGLKFKDLGVDIKLVENGMRNLTLNGMSMTDATGLVSQTGSAINNFTNNLGEMGYYGVTSGQFSDPYEAMSTMMLRWDENGNVKEESTDAILSAIGEKVDLVSQISSGDGNLQKSMVSKMLQNDLGYTQKQSSMLTERYFNNDIDGFKDLMDTIFAEEDGSTVTLENQESLENKLIDAANNVSELTKAEELLISSQQDLAVVGKELYDSIGKSWQEMIDTINGLSNKIGGGLANSGIANSIAGNLPTTILISSLISGVTSMFGSALMGKGSEAIKDILSKVMKAGGSSVDDVAKAGGKVVKSAVGSSSAASTVANSADDVLSATGKSASKVAQGVASSTDDVLVAAGKNSSKLMKGIGSTSDDVVAAIANSGDDVLRAAGSGTSKALSAFGKVFGALGIAVQAGFEFSENKKKGKDLTENILDTGTVVGGGLMGSAAGAAIGTAIFPGVGTAIGAIIGGIGGSSAAKYGTDVWDENKTKLTEEEKQAKAKAALYSDGSLPLADAQGLLRNQPYILSDPLANNKNISTLENAINSNGKSSTLMLEKQDKLNRTYTTASEQLYKENAESNTNLKTINSTVEASAKRLENALAKSNSKTTSSSGTKTSSSSSGSRNFSSSTAEKSFSELTPLDLLDMQTNALFGVSINNSASNSRSLSDPSAAAYSGSSSDSVIHKDLTQKTNMSADDIDAWINSNTSSNSKMRGMGSAFLKASEESGLDPLYLVAHAALETGWGTSNILNDKNNWFGIGAFDSSPYESAYGFNNLEAGIIEGAKWISENYTQDGQETLYKMVNDPEGWHNYATDPEWASKIGSIMLEGVGGDSSAIGALGSSGYTNSGSSSFSTGISYNDLNNSVYDNFKFKSYVLDMGSAEYSNGVQSYDPTKYQEYDKDFVYYDSQAMARKYYLDYVGSDVSSNMTSARDDRSTAYNQNPNFNINVNVTEGGGANYEAMAEEMRVAITNISEQYMGTSARITLSNYERANSNY